MPLLYHAYVYLEFLILACTIYILAPVLIWFVIIISTVVLYCLMKVKAESDELYEELMRKHFYGRSDDIPASDKTEHLKGCG